MANDGDVSSTNIDKRYAAKNMRDHCLARPANLYFFITLSFKVHFARRLSPKTMVMLFKDLFGDFETTGVERNTDTTLSGYDARVWNLSKNNWLLQGAIELLGRELKRLLIGSEYKRNQVRYSETDETFKKMLIKGYIQSVITYAKYTQTNFKVLLTITVGVLF